MIVCNRNSQIPFCFHSVKKCKTNYSRKRIQHVSSYLHILTKYKQLYISKAATYFPILGCPCNLTCCYSDPIRMNSQAKKEKKKPNLKLLTIYFNKLLLELVINSPILVIESTQHMCTPFKNIKTELTKQLSCSCILKSSEFFFHHICFACSSRGQVPYKINCGNNSFSFTNQKGRLFPINLKALKYLETENLKEGNEMEQVQGKNVLVKQPDYTNNSIYGTCSEFKQIWLSGLFLALRDNGCFIMPNLKQGCQTHFIH